MIDSAQLPELRDLQNIINVYSVSDASACRGDAKVRWLSIFVVRALVRRTKRPSGAFERVSRRAVCSWPEYLTYFNTSVIVNFGPSAP